MITLQPRKPFKLPIIADCINPTIFQGKTRIEIETLTVWEGNKQKALTDLFRVEEIESEGIKITINGDLGHVKQIGRGMVNGEILINGNVGMHLGEEMKGGRITVLGNSGSWAGSMLKGGMIEIHGNAGDYLAAPNRGSTQGMRGGRITVHGNAGNEAGAHMKRGLIKILGSAGQFAGFRMQDGAIHIQKDCAGRVGACMTGGKIIINGFLESVLPTFAIDSVKPKVKVDVTEVIHGPFYVFLGDLVQGGSGKLYVSKERNPHMGRYEKFL